MAEGVDGLLHKATRPAGKPPLTATVIERVVEMTLAEPPGERTHWTGRAMAKAAGVSHRSVQRIWAAHGLKPHRGRSFKLSNDPIAESPVWRFGLQRPTILSDGRLPPIRSPHPRDSGFVQSPNSIASAQIG